MTFNERVLPEIVKSIEKQLQEQGFTLDDEAEATEKIRNAVNVVRHRAATDSKTNEMFKRLMKQRTEQ